MKNNFKIPQRKEVLVHDVNLGSTDIYYTYSTMGEKKNPCAIILHGIWHNSNSTLSYATLLARDHFVINLDLHNHYKTDLSIMLTLEQLEDTLFSALKKILKKEMVNCRPELHGWSLGGGIALKLLAEHGDFFEDAVLICVTPMWKQYVFPNVSSNFNKIVFMSLGYIDKMKYTGKRYTWWALSHVKQNMPDYLVCQNDNRLLHNMDYSHYLPQIKNKVLLVATEFDKIAPKEMVELMSRQIYNSSIIYISKAGHLIPMENPDLLYQSINQSKKKAYEEKVG